MVEPLLFSMPSTGSSRAPGMAVTPLSSQVTLLCMLKVLHVQQVVLAPVLCSLDPMHLLCSIVSLIYQFIVYRLIMLLAIHGTYMANTYDFYKPLLSSEYPEVDGPVSVVTYVAAMDAAYTAFREKVAKAAKKAHISGHSSAEPTTFSLEDIDYAIFHSPYGKQAVKGHARLMFNDFKANPKASRFANISNPETILSASHAVSLTDKNTEKTFIAASKPSFTQKTDPGMACSKRLGNMYTASLYGCLASLLSTVEPASLLDKRVSLFSFGSGCASSFFTLRVKGDTSDIREKMDLTNRLANMKVVPPEEFVQALHVRVHIPF
jgi:hydroxymethylglutaryl-CoA synthase